MTKEHISRNLFFVLLSRFRLSPKSETIKSVISLNISKINICFNSELGLNQECCIQILLCLKTAKLKSLLEFVNSTRFFCGFFTTLVVKSKLTV